jgi:hypothetical protein
MSIALRGGTAHTCISGLRGHSASPDHSKDNHRDSASSVTAVMAIADATITPATLAQSQSPFRYCFRSVRQCQSPQSAPEIRSFRSERAFRIADLTRAGRMSLMNESSQVWRSFLPGIHRDEGCPMRRLCCRRGLLRKTHGQFVGNRGLTRPFRSGREPLSGVKTGIAATALLRSSQDIKSKDPDLPYG